MPEVTVCIPAYRSAGFIAATLRSVQAQTFRDFRVDVGLEPVDADATLEACGPFLADGRFAVRLNPSRLGWDGNVRELLGRVETPLAIVLPHDDAWHPDLLASLVGVLRARPDAVAAFADVLVLGAMLGVRSTEIPDGTRADRVVGYLLGTSLSLPWRGLMRAAVLREPFPTNPHGGFGGEYEWALHLVGSGPVIRVSLPLFLKHARVDDASVTTVWRRDWTEEAVRASLEHQRSATLRRALAGSEPGEHERITAAAEAAMLLRWIRFVKGRYPPDAEWRERLERISGYQDPARPDEARRIRSRATLAEALMLRASSDDPERIVSRLHDAVRLDPASSEARLELCRQLLRHGRAMEALPHLVEAGRLAPMTPGLRRLETRLMGRLGSELGMPVTP